MSSRYPWETRARLAKTSSCSPPAAPATCTTVATAPAQRSGLLIHTRQGGGGAALTDRLDRGDGGGVIISGRRQPHPADVLQVPLGDAGQVGEDVLLLTPSGPGDLHHRGDGDGQVL